MWPTQEFIQGQWWSIFMTQLDNKKDKFCATVKESREQMITDKKHAWPNIYIAGWIWFQVKMI